MKIRYFEYPQILGSLTSCPNTLRFIRRNLRGIFPDYLISFIDKFFSRFEKPVTFKLQMAMYITGSNSVTDREQLLEVMKERKIVRPCHVSTVMRLMLSDLSLLPTSVINSDKVVAICDVHTFVIDVRKKEVRELVDSSMIIDPDTYLMMETDSI